MRSFRLIAVSTLSIVVFLFAAPSVVSSGLVRSMDLAGHVAVEVPVPAHVGSDEGQDRDAGLERDADQQAQRHGFRISAE